MRIPFVRRTILSLVALTLATGSGANPTLAATPSATPPAAAVKKDPCLLQSSKFARTQCENFSHSAPGDEYFGRMKLSYLGINNTFRDGTISAGAYTTDQNIINKVAFADEALHQWASRYPGDPELARSYFLAITMFKKIYTKQYQQEAFQYMQVLTKHFPATYFGKLEKADLSRGFTEHWFDLPQLCPTPLPSNAPLPENTPSATMPPSPSPGQPKVDLITPPCVQPSPSPAPTTEPTAPMTEPSASPMTEPSASPMTKPTAPVTEPTATP